MKNRLITTLYIYLKQHKNVIKQILFLCIISGLFCNCHQTPEKKKVQPAYSDIKKTITNYLYWYKKHGTHLETVPIIWGYNQDTIKKDSVLKVRMPAVEVYLSNFKKSNLVSENFLNDLRVIYKTVSDGLARHPVKDYYGPLPGLQADLLFGFEPEETFDHIHEGKFTNIYVMDDKALVKFVISKSNIFIFTLTKTKGKWLIDSQGDGASDTHYDYSKLYP
ncbi:hypothetical protein ACFQ3S_05775 [Mucilaginibacter terrae]|uniref:hypothetical protein n=1 Tax=Mucilaginibacter terrae TaxID=1955052 RepID=UPI00362E06CD